MHNAIKYAVASGVALQTPIPLHTTSQKLCFWIPRMVSLNCTMPKNMLWVLGWRSKHPYHCTAQARNCVFGHLGRLSLNCTMPKNMLWVLGCRSKHTYHCTPQAGNCVSGYLGWGSLKCTMPTNMLWLLGWRSKHQIVVIEGIFQLGIISSQPRLFPPKRLKSIQSGVLAYFWGV